MSTNPESQALLILAESLEIPESAYEAAKVRYEDLNKWILDTGKSQSARFSPVISPQGSFRLGTATLPVKSEDYDLDLSCKLQAGILKSTHSQNDLKTLVGRDLETYRNERKIQEALEEKRRCWRIHYKDALGFHIDTVPGIPQDAATAQVLGERMVKAGLQDALAQRLTATAMAITDNRSNSYRQISEDWRISNPEGFAIWFESRMRQANSFLEARARLANAKRIEELPAYRWKTPLQRAIQILKRHRDLMFKNAPDSKPISIIITTLAARAYKGESDIRAALNGILEGMRPLVASVAPRVANPVNPIEDFADKWASADGRALRLEENFYAWLDQAKVDLRRVESIGDEEEFRGLVLQKFGAVPKASSVSEIVSRIAVRAAPTPQRIQNAPKPWLI